MITNGGVLTFIPTREQVIESNPAFFMPDIMNHYNTTHDNWTIDLIRGIACVVVDRPETEAKACYLIDPLTYKLSFMSHIGAKLTYIG